MVQWPSANAVRADTLQLGGNSSFTHAIPHLLQGWRGAKMEHSQARPLPGNFTHEASHWPRNLSTQIAVISHTEENNQLLKQLSVELEELWLSRYTPRAARKDGADFR